MQTITVQVEGNQGLKMLYSLEEKQIIRIVKEESDSPALPGAPLGLKAFRNWIEHAESTPIIDLKDARARWTKRKRKLMQLTR
jgi:hypothetical protein